jgi:hypothetical protein
VCADWAGYRRDDAVRARFLDAVARYGLGLLRGVPAADGRVLAVAETVGYVRETNYGRLFDVRAEPADPKSFDVLTGTPFPFGYADGETELRAWAPLISLSPRGRIAGVRLNNRSMLPLRLPAEEAEAAYAAHRVWAVLLDRPEFRLRLRLAPGDCLVFDNTRVLHARTAFSAAESPGTGSPGTGERHLQGCYADLDGLLSTLAVLRRFAPDGGGSGTHQA